MTFKSFIEENNIAILKNTIKYYDLDEKKIIKKTLPLTIESIHKHLESFKYQKLYNKVKSTNDNIEKYRMIPFSYIYYYFIAKNLRLPSPQEYIDIYINTFCIKLESGKFTFKEEFLIAQDNIEFEYNELASRMLRAFNSFNREIEFLFNIYEHLDLSKALIKYELADDTLDGIDFMVLNLETQKYIGIATYVGTARSNNFKNRKNTTRHDYSNINMIDVVANMPSRYNNNCNVISCGDVYIYSNNVVEDVIRQLKL